MRFRAGSAPARALAESGDAASWTGALAGLTSVPLRAKQALSGGALLVELDAAQIAARVAPALEKRPGVASVQPGADPKAPIAVCLVPGAGGSGCKRVDAETAAQLAAALEREIGLPLIGQASPAGELLVVPDWARATERARQELSRHSDVEFVEPNLMLRPFDPGLMP